MTPAALASRLGSNRDVLVALASNVPDDQARWKPSVDQWSILEVVCHLADEERDDFRRRLDLTLHSPDLPWPSIDPPQWAIDRRYNERSLAESLKDFSFERQQSVEWLNSLGEIDSMAARKHPSLGVIRAGDLAHAWLAHDLIHIRQMARLHYEHLRQAAVPFSLAYAGNW